MSATDHDERKTPLRARDDIGPLTRRLFMQSAAVASMTPALPAFAQSGGCTDLGCPVIDVHGHIFNAHDVAIVEHFKTICDEREISGFFRFIANFVVSLLTRAPEAMREISDLQHQRQTVERRRPDVRPIVHQSLLQLRDEAIISEERSEEAPRPFWEKMPSSHKFAQSPLRSLYTNDAAASLNFILQRMSGPGGRDLDLPKRRSADMSAFFGQPHYLRKRRIYSDRTMSDAADWLVRLMRLMSDIFGQVLNLAANVMMSRHQLAVDLINLTEPVVANNRRGPRLVTPSLCDYDIWYDLFEDNEDRRRSTPLAQQIEVGSEISLSHRLPDNSLVNGFVSFCPLRAVFEDLEQERKQRTGERPSGRVVDGQLSLVRKAILDKGFIGVKLYPPMGFRAINNVKRDRDEQLAEFEKKWRQRGIVFGGKKIGERLDEKLNALYEFCDAHRVPIIAHCSNSQSSAVNAALHAAPEHWETLLGKYPKLRLNLAHFGGAWCLAEKYESDNEEKRCIQAKAWPGEIIAMVKSGKYPNLYFDVADMQPIIEEGEATCARGSSMGTFASEVSQRLGDGTKRTLALSRMLYGSDWFMLSSQPSHEKYLVRARNFYCTLNRGDESRNKDFQWRNAARFLGLTKQGETTARLRAFYDDYPDKLATLEAIVVADERPADKAKHASKAQTCDSG